MKLCEIENCFECKSLDRILGTCHRLNKRIVCSPGVDPECPLIGWVPLSERLPEIDVPVLVLIDGEIDVKMKTGMFEPDEWCHPDNDLFVRESSISHWMSLPKIPKP